jgi:hypothetical protein
MMLTTFFLCQFGSIRRLALRIEQQGADYQKSQRSAADS